MKKRPNLVLREPVKLYEYEKVDKELEVKKEESIIEKVEKEKLQLDKKTLDAKPDELIQTRTSLSREKMSPRVRQIWDYFCKKAKSGDEIRRSFNLTRAEVMKEAGIGSTNTYRDALRKFQELNLMEIELRPGVNSGSNFILTEKGIEEIS